MPADGFFNAMLGLFIFFICPFLIFGYMDKKSRLWSAKRKEEKIAREKNEVIVEYENIIQNGVELYNMGKYILEKSHLFYFAEEDPQIISRGCSIMVCLPIENSHSHDFERICRFFYEEKGNKDIYNGKDITEYFHVENISDCENEFGSVVGSYENSFVSYVGRVQKKEIWSFEEEKLVCSCDWEKSVVVSEILKRVEGKVYENEFK